MTIPAAGRACTLTLAFQLADRAASSFVPAKSNLWTLGKTFQDLPQLVVARAWLTPPR